MFKFFLENPGLFNLSSIPVLRLEASALAEPFAFFFFFFFEGFGDPIFDLS